MTFRDQIDLYLTFRLAFRCSSPVRRHGYVVSELPLKPVLWGFASFDQLMSFFLACTFLIRFLIHFKLPGFGAAFQQQQRQTVLLLERRAAGGAPAAVGTDGMKFSIKAPLF